MIDFKRSSNAQALSAAAIFANRNTTTASRISALVADAGLGCKFQSIVRSDGAPFAEMAVVFAPDGERVYDERTIRLAAGPTAFARGAATFRLRAATEFAEAPGMPHAVRLFLPHYCFTPEVERFGPSMEEILAESGLAPARVIAELLPGEDEGLTSIALRAAELRALGLCVSLRIDAPDARASGLLLARSLDFVHFAQPPDTVETIEQMRAFVDVAAMARVRVIIGDVDGSDDYTSAIEGPRGVLLFYGDGIAGPRFLC